LKASMFSPLLLMALFVSASAESPIISLRLRQDQIAIVRTAAAITTRFVFSDQIQEVICGDLYDPGSGQGSIVIHHSGNDVFVKPVVQKGTTNMFVKAGEGGSYTYCFELVIGPMSQANWIVNVAGAQLAPATSANRGNKRLLPPPVMDIIRITMIPEVRQMP